MKKNYDKDINVVIDVTKKIECVNLSIGANKREDFAWITNNVEVFKQESIDGYNKVISSILNQKQVKLCFIVYEKKDTEFSAVEKHLGIGHNFRFKDTLMDNKSKDFNMNNNLRYAYVKLNSFTIEQIPILHCGDLVFIKDYAEIEDCLGNLVKCKNIFESFYDKGCLLATFRDFWTEGNALVFYSKNKQDLSDIILIAEKEGFIIN